MSRVTTGSDPSALLDHVQWLSKLAGRLTQASTADDLAQDAWVHALGHPEARPRSARAWLGQVARNTLRMRVRGEQRREVREAHVERPAEPSSPEELVARAERLRLLLGLVEALEEPFRTTVLRHYFEARSLADIARLDGTPPGTVRWRLKEGLQRLRTALDQEHGGDRSVWLSAFAPLVGPRSAARDVATSTGATKMTTFVQIATLTALIATGGVTAVRCGASPTPPSPEPSASSVASATTPARGSTLGPARASEPAPAAVSAVLAHPGLDQPRARFRSPDERHRFMATLEDARIRRIRAAGVFDDEQALQAAAAAGLLDDIEQMMMMEDAASIAAACIEPSLAVPELLRLRLTAIGEPDVGTVIEDVEVIDPHDGEELGELATCVRESLFLLQMPPPRSGGRELTELTLRAAADGPAIVDWQRHVPSDDEDAPDAQ